MFENSVNRYMVGSRNKITKRERMEMEFVVDGDGLWISDAILHLLQPVTSKLVLTQDTVGSWRNIVVRSQM